MHCVCRALCKSRADEAGKVVANNRILVEDHKEATRRLGTLEQKYQDKKDECNSLKIKQVSQESSFYGHHCTFFWIVLQAPGH